MKNKIKQREIMGRILCCILFFAIFLGQPVPQNAQAAKKKKIKKANKQGVIFQWKAVKKEKKHYIFKISRDNARLYKYSVKFIKKRYEGNIRSYTRMYPELRTYSKNMLACHWLYDYGVGKTYSRENAKESLSPDNFFEVADAVGTHWEIDNMLGMTPEDIAAGFDKLIEHVFGENWLVKDKRYFSEGYTRYCNITLMSYEEFYETLIAKMGSDQKVFDYLEPYIKYDPVWLILTTKDFCDLSDAMKIYVISDSGYFRCRKRDTGYGMLYDSTRGGSFCGSWQGMKKLYDNKAAGVCMDYALYECLVFNQLGIRCYFNSSKKIAHAWSVVKVKNSKGKTLWIPFDYGIGPADNLEITDAQEKYINTEEKTWKLYLSGIPGAPKKQNYDWEDFN